MTGCCRVEDVIAIFGVDADVLESTTRNLVNDPTTPSDVLGQFATNYKTKGFVRDALIDADGSIDIDKFAAVNGKDFNEAGSVDDLVALCEGKEDAIRLTTERLVNDPTTSSDVLNQLFANKDTRYTALGVVVEDENDVDGWQHLLGMYNDGTLSDDAWGFITSDKYDQYASLTEPFDETRFVNPETGIPDYGYGVQYLEAGYPMMLGMLDKWYDEDPDKMLKTIDEMAKSGDLTDWSMPNKYASAYEMYRGDPSNYPIGISVAQQRVTWTDGFGKSHYLRVFDNNRVWSPEDGQYYDIDTQRVVDGKYELTYKMNHGMYMKWLNGDYGAIGWTELCNLTDPETGETLYGKPTYKQKISSGYSGDGGGGGGGGRSSLSHRSYASGKPGLFIDSAGLEADVIIQSMVVGHTDTGIIPLPAGEYTITVAKAGYHSRTTVVLVYATKTTSIRLVLYEKEPDICMFVDDIGGIDEVTTEHYLYIYFRYKRWFESADRMALKCDPPIGTFPPSVTLDDTLFVFYLLVGDYTAAYDMTAAGTVCVTMGVDE